MYVTYNNFEFRVDKYLNISYVGNNNAGSNGTSGGNTGSSGGTSSGGNGETLYGCRRYIEVEVTDAFFDKMTLNVDIPNKDRVKAIEYYIDGKLIHTGLEKTYTVNELEVGKEYNISAIVEYEPDEIITVTKTSNMQLYSTSEYSDNNHEIKEIDWNILENMAKIISDNEVEKKVNSNTGTVTFAVGKDEYISIAVGNRFMLDGKVVRIIGFNHDELTDKAAYGGNNTHAGISFEYLDFLIEKASMNSTNENTGGWEACKLRQTLNGDAYNSLKQVLGEKTIKQVKKSYKAVSTQTTFDYCDDYLWLLSIGELYSDYGNEESYKCFYTTEINGGRYPTFVKPSQYTDGRFTNVGNSYWTRTWPTTNGITNWDNIDYGAKAGVDSTKELGVAPGFAI